MSPADGVRLSTIAVRVGGQIVGGDERAVVDLTVAQDQVAPGVMFCCLVGARRDGHERAAEAVAAGAAALMVERRLPLDIPQVVVPGVRAALPAASAVVFGDPARQLRLVGVTGTDGKSTTALILCHLLGGLGRAAVVGNVLPAGRNTPEAPDLHRRLRQLVSAGTRWVVLEASSAGLVAGRLDGLQFEAAVFTNLSQDHIGEVHADMEAYFLAKRRLFEPERSALAVVNADDAFGRRLLSWRNAPSLPYGLADAEGLESTRTGNRFTWRAHPVQMHLPGLFNVYNALAAATASAEVGLPLPDVISRLGSIPQPPGRLERHQVPDGPSVVIDYAHTPAGLEAVLRQVRSWAPDGRVLAIFGCGGDRDPAKRPVMGRLASELADLTIVTSDNPRGEDPAEIARQILTGVQDERTVRVELDRRSAILEGLKLARPNDVIVLAGKGAESYQEIAGRQEPFSDAAVLAELSGSLD